MNINEHNEQLLESILQCYIDEQNIVLQNTPSFLSLIGRSYDENFISKCLAHILKNDYSFAVKLLNYYFGCTELLKIKNIRVVCEKTMNSGRADIFAEIDTETNEKFTLTIENKIYSGVHSTAEDEEQTATYCRFVNEFYINSKNAFLLLKPKFNPTRTKCEQFKSITYDDILKFISNDNTLISASCEANYIKLDFINHIKEYLTMPETKFTNTDKEILLNLHEYRNILAKTEKSIIAFRNWLFSHVSIEFFHNEKNYYDYYCYEKNEGEDAWQIAEQNGGMTNDIKDDDECCKFYRVGKWYKKGSSDGYWFYVEIKFNNNDPKSIVVQSVMKRYGNKPQNSVVKQFIDSDYFKIYNKYISENSQYYIFNTKEINKKIDYKVEPFSSKWQEQIKQCVIVQVKEQTTEMDNIFKSFEEFIKKQNDKPF